MQPGRPPSITPSVYSPACVSSKRVSGTQEASELLALEESCSGEAEPVMVFVLSARGRQQNAPRGETEFAFA